MNSRWEIWISFRFIYLHTSCKTDVFWMKKLWRHLTHTKEERTQKDRHACTKTRDQEGQHTCSVYHLLWYGGLQYKVNHGFTQYAIKLLKVFKQFLNIILIYPSTPVGVSLAVFFQSELYITHQVYGYSINVQSLHFTWMQGFSLNSINAFTIFVWSLTKFFFELKSELLSV